MHALVNLNDDFLTVCGLTVSGGLSGAVGKFTGALGDLTAKLTGDDEYQEQRRRTTKLGENLEGAAKVSHSFYHTARCFDLTI